MNPLAVFLLILPISAQADLFKCTDNKGTVTYSSAPCVKIGLKESKIIPPPPPPAIDAPAKIERVAKNTAEKIEPAKPVHTAALKVMKTLQSNGDSCAQINADIGKTLDEMDTARGKNISAAKQAEWGNQLKSLQVEKSRLGCF